MGYALPLQTSIKKTSHRLAHRQSHVAFPQLRFPLSCYIHVCVKLRQKKIRPAVTQLRSNSLGVGGRIWRSSKACWETEGKSHRHRSTLYKNSRMLLASETAPDPGLEHYPPPYSPPIKSCSLTMAPPWGPPSPSDTPFPSPTRTAPRSHSECPNNSYSTQGALWSTGRNGYAADSSHFVICKITF